jgi:hypothetical protein
VARAFTPGERGRASELAAIDARIRVALDSRDGEVPEVLAAGPELVRWWLHRTNPYAAAIVSAAIDARRIGVSSPVSVNFLSQAADGYCTSREQAEAPEDWLGHALTDATQELYGAASALRPIGAGIGSTAGYEVSDYLLQYAMRRCHSVWIPKSTWEASAAFVDENERRRVIRSAQVRRLYGVAIPLARQYQDDQGIEPLLADMLTVVGGYDELRERANAGDIFAAHRLARLLAADGALQEAISLLQEWLGYPNSFAAGELAHLMAQVNDRQGLEARADAGDFAAEEELVKLLVQAGDEDALSRRAEAHALARQGLADLLANAGERGKLRTMADAGNAYAAQCLAKLLVKNGDRDEAAKVLRAWADSDDFCAVLLADLLADAGDYSNAVEILARNRRPLNQTETWMAIFGIRERRLADLLAETGDLQALRKLANSSHSGYVQDRLADLLIEAGGEDELKDRARSGDYSAADRLAAQLAEAGNTQEALELLLEWAALPGSFDLTAPANRLNELLFQTDNLEELETRANVGDSHAAELLDKLLARSGDLDGLRARVNSGDREAPQQIIDLLQRTGHLAESARLSRFGFDCDASIPTCATWLSADHMNLLRLQTRPTIG